MRRKRKKKKEKDENLLIIKMKIFRVRKKRKFSFYINKLLRCLFLQKKKSGRKRKMFERLFNLLFYFIYFSFKQ